MRPKQNSRVLFVSKSKTNQTINKHIKKYTQPRNNQIPENFMTKEEN